MPLKNFIHPSDVIGQYKTLFTDGFYRWPAEPTYLLLILKVKDVFPVPIVEPNRIAIPFGAINRAKVTIYTCI